LALHTFRLLLLVLMLTIRAWPADRPNIILIVADDLGYGDVSSFGAKDIATPNIDRLAAEGIKLTSFYAAPLCTPSRAQIMLGQYPVRSGLVRVLYPESKDGIDASELTVGKALKDAGYTTAIIGKWHLGHLPQYLPTRHGFDTWLGIPYSNDMIPTPVMRGDKVVEEPARQETLTKRYTEEALRIIREPHDRPYFLFLAHTMPHFPLAVSAGMQGKSIRGLYGDVIQELDWSTGEIIRALKETNQDENTLLIFTSDNGPWLEQGKSGGSAGPLRSGKMTVFEGGIRVPFVARWPGHIPPGTVSDDPAMNIDFLPTFVKVAGSSVPHTVKIDGKDLMPLLSGHGKRDGEEFFFYMDGKLRAMRDGKWKIILPWQGEARGVHNSGNEQPQELELHDLVSDINESKNVAAEHHNIVKKMVARAHAFDREVRKTAKPDKR